MQEENNETKGRIKKKDACIIGGVIAGIVLILIIVLAVVKPWGSKEAKEANTENTQNQTESTSEEGNTEPYAIVQKDDNDTNVHAEIVKSNSWVNGDEYFTQFDVTIVNDGDSKVTQWSLQTDVDGLSRIDQAWNCDAQSEGQKIQIVPKDYALNVDAHNKTGGVGLILVTTKETDIADYNLDVITEDGSNSQISDSNSNAVTIVDDKSSNSDTNAAQNDASAAVVDTKDLGAAVKADGISKLHVEGTSLMNESGQRVQLKGVSTHGLNYYPQYVNYDAFATLKNDWHANVVRLAMYTQENGGYCSGGNKEELKTLIDNGVNYATQLGMYVIIDWHILSDRSPNTHKDESIAFFDEMSKKYSGHNNVIYEICNEPVNVSWNNDIKPYAESVISTIRNNDKDAVVLVGTNTWSQDVDDVIGNKLSDTNVMYVLHFYAGTHKDNIRSKLKKALNNDVPVFVSECNICDASGNGNIDYNSANTWLDLLNSNGVSFIAWSLCNKNETSAIISSNCDKLSGWNDSELSETGKWFKAAISN